MNRKLSPVVCSLIILVHMSGIATAFPPGPGAGSAITYQGQLKFGGVELNANCDFAFRLYDAPEGGALVAEVGSEAAPVAIDVQKGVFTATLDFGDGAFDGGERWLEVLVRDSALGGAFSTLTPRQQLTAAPYALHALHGGDVTSLDEAYNKGGPGAGRTVNTNAGPLSLEGPGGLYVQGRVGIGVADPTMALEVSGGIRLRDGYIAFPDGTIQTTAAIYAAPGTEQPRGSAFWESDGIGNQTSLFPDPIDTFVGIGTANPAFPLHVIGDILADGSVRAHAFAGASPFVAEAPAGVSRLFISEISGNTAIGHTSMPMQIEPVTLLHLADDLEDPYITLEINPNDNPIGAGEAGILLRTGAAGGSLLGDISVDENMADTPLLVNAFSLNNVALVPNGGRVGIGTTTPSVRLHLRGTETFPILFESSSTDSMVTTFRNSSSAAAWEYSVSGSVGAFGGFVPAGSLYIYKAGLPDTIPLIGGADGRIGIGFRFDQGQDTPMATLHVGGVPGVDGIMFPDGTLQTTAFAGGAIDHGSLMGLLDDDHPQYVHIDGRPGGQVVDGGTVLGDTLTLRGSIVGAGPVLINPAGDANVSIGTTPTVARLQVGSIGFLAQVLASTSTSGTWLALDNSVGGGTNFQLISTGTNNGEEERKLLFGTGPAPSTVTSTIMTLDADNNHVGIGTAFPELRLHVISNSDVTAAGGGFMQLGSSAGENIGIDNNEIQARIPGGANDLAINREGGNVRLGAVSFDVNLGIGPVVPIRSIDVNDIQAVMRLDTVAHGNGSVVELRNVTAGVPAFLGAINFLNNGGVTIGQIGYLGTNDLTFRVNGLERVRIDPDGDLGIGTTTPGEKLDVIGNGRFSVSVLADTLNSDSDPADMAQDLSLQTEGTTHIFIEADTGNVGIGSPPPVVPEEALHVAGCVKADCYKLAGEKAVEVSPLSAVAASANLTMIPSPTGTMKVRPVLTGVQNVMVPINVSTSLLGTTQGLVRVRVCYRVSSSTTFINNLRARATQDNGMFVNLIDDPTNLNSSSWTCYETANLMPAATIDGPMFLQLELSVAGTGSTHEIEIGRITAFVMDI
ncbi:MAG: hypothetical protein DCC65_13400 [Planctomycetota bacterium]|nr:MAG: hypothetical protein DCC65_13400 [Planctomycetota bacterium]